MNTKSDDLIIRFLLGELSGEERSQFEGRFLADNDFFEEVLATEDALIEQYLLGQLSGEQRERAETLFQSSPRQRREVEFTEQLIASLREAKVKDTQPDSAVQPPTSAALPNKSDIEEEPVPTHSEQEAPGHKFSIIPTGLKDWVPRLIWVTFALVCFAVGAWFIYRYTQRGSNPEVERITVERDKQETPDNTPQKTRGHAENGGPVEREKEKRERPEESVAQSQAPRPNRISSILLAPAALERGGGGSQTLTLKAETKQIQLQLELDESQRYGRYDVLLTTFDGRKVWSKESFDAGEIKRGRLTLVLPSSLLEYEDYRIELKGLPETGDPVHVADYIFKVRK